MADHAHGDPAAAAPSSDPTTYWEGRYGERDQIWSGKPNAALVAAVSTLAPGRALDLGCGEGADSLWLAEQGRAVTGLDVSSLAIARAGREAARRGIPESRFTGLVQDLAGWQPAERYDLVSACFLHSPIEFPRADVLRRAAGAVRSGGHLLVVGHAEPPPWGRLLDHAGHGHHDLLDAAGELAQLGLETGAWESVIVEDRDREATGPHGEAATFARRRGPGPPGLSGTGGQRFHHGYHRRRSACAPAAGAERHTARRGPPPCSTNGRHWTAGWRSSPAEPEDSAWRPASIWPGPA